MITFIFENEIKKATVIFRFTADQESVTIIIHQQNFFQNILSESMTFTITPAKGLIMPIIIDKRRKTFCDAAIDALMKKYPYAIKHIDYGINCLSPT